MANQMWVEKQSLYCDRIKQTVYLLEERVYPADSMPDVGAPFQVKSRKCSEALECNGLGYPCRWSGLNPLYDPFHEEEADSSH